MESSRDTTLKLPSVQKSDEGSYQCVVSNCAGSQISKAANLCIGKNPHFSQLCETSQHFFSSPFLYPNFSMYHQEFLNVQLPQGSIKPVCIQHNCCQH